MPFAQHWLRPPFWQATIRTDAVDNCAGAPAGKGVSGGCTTVARRLLPQPEPATCIVAAPGAVLRAAAKAAAPGAPAPAPAGATTVACCATEPPRTHAPAAHASSTGAAAPAPRAGGGTRRCRPSMSYESAPARRRQIDTLPSCARAQCARVPAGAHGSACSSAGAHAFRSPAGGCSARQGAPGGTGTGCRRRRRAGRARRRGARSSPACR